MKKLICKLPALLFTLVLSGAGALPYARANVTFNSDSLVNEILPVGAAPWMAAALQDIAVDHASLTMTSGMPLFEFADEVLFYSIPDSGAVSVGGGSIATVDATPAPDSYAMLLAGFFTMGMIARCRMRRVAA